MQEGDGDTDDKVLPIPRQNSSTREIIGLTDRVWSQTYNVASGAYHGRPVESAPDGFLANHRVLRERDRARKSATRVPVEVISFYQPSSWQPNTASCDQRQPFSQQLTSACASSS